MTDVQVPTGQSGTERRKAKLRLYQPVARQQGGSGFDFGSSIGEIDFQFNPKEYSTSVQADWKVKAKKRAVEVPEYNGCQPANMTVELFLDGTETGHEPIKRAIEQLTDSVRPIEDLSPPSPPLAAFSWELGPTFPCVVKSVAINVTMFTPQGQPLRASCKLSLMEYHVEPPPTNPTSGARRSAKAHRVSLGESLASIAHRELGSPVLWRAIAITNGIEDPFALTVGQELLIPARSDVRRLA